MSQPLREPIKRTPIGRARLAITLVAPAFALLGAGCAITSTDKATR